MATKFLTQATIATVLLGGCSEGIDVAIRQRGTTVEFVFRQSSGGKPACIRTASVTPMIPDDAQPVWQVDTDANGPCIDRLVYGRPMDGVTMLATPPALVPGVRYKVVARATGSLGGKQFTIGKR